MNPRIFLSSTFLDLHAERAIVREVAQATGWDLSQFETIPDLKDWQVLTHVHRRIRSCEVFLNLLGSRYGSQVPELHISYTHFEFALARKLGMPIVSLVSRDGEPDSGMPEISNRGSALSNLRREIAAAEADGSCVRHEYSRQTQGDFDLRVVTEKALTEGRRRYLAGVFRPGNVAESSRLVQLLRSLSDQPRGETGLLARMRGGHTLRAEFASYFWDYNLPLITMRGKLALLFGCGISATFLVIGMLDALQWMQLYGRAELDVVTSHAMVPLMLLQEAKELSCNILMLPGEIRHTHMATVFDEKACRTLKRLRQTSHGLCVCGLSLPHKDDGATLASTEAFEFAEASAGVGYSAVLFMNTAGMPDVESRLAAFLANGTTNRLQTVPLSICIGTDSAPQRSAIAGVLARGGFTAIEPSYDEREYPNSSPVIAMNGAFQENFGPLIG